MRLTLRTLLAYLDDTLEPSQAKIIGQKVAESEQARELVEHIKQVTRRRRITTPTGLGSKFDPNTIAEYLDSEVTPEQAAEVEQICLASDVHLAEVAACHQILALVLGEPALVPPTAKQRMYGLVKGPEAIPFRKAPRPTSRKANDRAADNEEADETLRMGLPPVETGSQWSHRLMLLGGGVVAASLLALAIWQALPGKDGPKGIEVVKNDSDKKDIPEKKDEDVKLPPPQIKKEEPSSTPPLIVPLPSPLPPPGSDPNDKKSVAPPALPDVRLFPPENRPVSLGKYLMPPAKEASVVVYDSPERSEWKRLWGGQVDVQAGRTYVSMPGTRGELLLQRDAQLSLWGLMPEIFPALPLMESVVELHSHDTFDVDLTLQRGRIEVSSTRQDKPVLLRVRFENPTQPQAAEYMDLALQGKGTKVLIDRWSAFPPGEPFYKNPKDTNRLGPATFMLIWVVQGPVMVRQGGLSYAMSGPPGQTLLVWNSREKLSQPKTMASLPDEVSPNLPPPPGLDKKIRANILRARDDVSALLENRPLDVALSEAFKVDDRDRRIMITRFRAAVGDVGSLVDGLAEEDKPEVRQAAIGGLRHWIASSRDNEYKLYEQLVKSRYSLVDAHNIMELFHAVALPPHPDYVDTLVEYLNHPRLVIREMAYFHLLALAPGGRGIAFNPTADFARRQQAQKDWREAIRKGALNPPPLMK